MALTRSYWADRRRAILTARHLLTINWADSAPGLSWPEAYYATPLPLYEHWVVTASVDSPDGTDIKTVQFGWPLGMPPGDDLGLAKARLRLIGD